jgi:hypothetical protein
MLGTVDPHDKDGRIYVELIADATIQKAAQGDVRAAKEIALRTEGRPHKRV